MFYRNTVLFLGILLVAGVSVAQPIHGTLEGVLGPGTVRVDGDCDVISGTELRIEPNTAIEFLGHFEIEIHGKLIAEGLENQEITFAPAAANESGWGGVRFNSYEDTSRISWCSFSGATGTGSSPDGFGGAVYLYRSVAEIENCRFTANYARFGGAVYCFACDPVLVNCTFEGNTAGERGGAVYASTATIDLVRCLFIGNTCAADGGAVYLFASNSNLINCTFADNDAGQGAGMYINHSYPSLINTIVSRSFTSEALHSINASYTQVMYSCLYDNEGGITNDPDGFHGAFAFQYRTNANGDSCDHFNNIFIDPQFFQPGRNDYHLSDDSPCIDAGDPASDPDPNDTVADMGVYYFDAAGIDEEWNDPGHLQEFEILNCYPNPFNSTTRIHFELEHSSHVSLVVYDITGRMVENLIQEDMESGMQELSWHAGNLSSGTYFLHLKTSFTNQVRRISFVK